MESVFAGPSGMRAPHKIPDARVLDLSDRLLDLLPTAVCVCDRDGRILRYNRRAVELWGRAPQLDDAAERFCGAHRMYRLDGGPLPHPECPTAEDLRSGVSIRDQQIVVERPDGSRIYALVNVEALREYAGTLVGAVSCLQDITEHKRIEAGLRKSREDLDDFFEKAAVAMHWVGPDGIILRANQAELDLLGFRREEYVGRHIADFHADRAVIDDILGRLSRGEKIEKYSARLRAKNGTIKHVIISSNVQFRDGEFMHTRCVTLDVTAERAAEAMSRESERNTRNLLAALPAAVYTTDAAGRITYYNAAAVELAGREPTLGSDEWCVTWKLHSPDGTPLPHDQCPMAIALKENRPVRGVEAVAERPDGTRVPFLPFPTPLHDDSGALIGAVNMLVDLTEIKRAETALRESEARFAAIVAQATAGIAETDVTGRFAHVNERYCQMVGYTSTELSRMRMQDITHPEDLPRNLELFEKLVQTGADFTIEKRYIRKDDAVVWVSNSVSGVRDSRGQVANFVAVSIDITERKLAEEQRNLVLREMNHRVKNLFAVTAGLVTMSARSAPTPRDVATLVQARLGALARAHELIRPSFASTEQNVDREPAKLDALLQAVCSPFVDLESTVERARVTFRGPDLPVGPKAATSLALVFHELATNAAKYGSLSTTEGSVEIDWSVQGGELLLKWEERDGPPIDVPPIEEGFGSLLARRSVDDQLGGQLSHLWRREGLIIHLSALVDRLTT
jgi:PAS domain S-box-containing protein